MQLVPLYAPGVFSNVLHNYSHPVGGRGMCIALLVNGPVFFHLGPRFYVWSLGTKRSWFRSSVYWWGCTS
jgi:hypothetical protein